MKYFKIYVLILVFMALLSSCEKYLDVKNQSSQAFVETAADCQILLDNYNTMNTGYPSDGQASSDDYYLGANRYPGNLSQENKDLYTWQALSIRNSSNPQWIKPYSVVYFANVVLESLDKIKKSTDPITWNNLRGAALFYRSYAFWNIAQLYAKPYGSTSLQDLGIPLRTSSDINDVFRRATVKETYNRITQDLEEAAGLLNETSVVSTRPNKSSAYAMLARVYLSMEDYPRALVNANASLLLKSALLDYKTLSTTSTTPFTRFNVEVLFHSIITSDNSTAFPLISSGSDSSPLALINMDVYNSFDADDLRKTIFFKQNIGAFTGTFRFTGNYEPATTSELFNGLTTGEMYLTRAECYARAGNTAAALADLNTLLKSRWAVAYTDIVNTDPNYDTADEVLAKVLLERRKELIMRGQRWTDLRRLTKDTRFKIDLSRTVTENSVTTTYTLPANDPRYTLMIPVEVINLSNGVVVQNER